MLNKENQNEVSSVTRSSNLKILATGNNKGEISLLKFPTVNMGAIKKDYLGHCESIKRLRFSFDDFYLYSIGGKDKTVIIWETDFGIPDQHNKINRNFNEDDEGESGDDNDFQNMGLAKNDFIQPKVKQYGADKFNKGKTKFKQEEDDDDNMLFEEEDIDKGDEYADFKPWIGALKEPNNYLKPPLKQDEAPAIEISLNYAFGYRSMFFF